MPLAQHRVTGRYLLRVAAWRAVTALTATAAIALSSGCSRSTFLQNPYHAIPRSTPEQIAQVHQPEALHADLEAIVALHERTNPNPYLRASKDSVRRLADRLKASVDRPMTRREFLPFVMELQAGYRSDHYGQGVPHEDLEAALARGERLLPFRAEPRDDGLVVVAVAEGERAIEPGDTIARIGSFSAADHLARLRALVPNETARYRDTQVRERYRTLAWAAGIALPTQVEVIRPDGSRRTVTVEGVGDGVRKTERTAATHVSASTHVEPPREVLVDSPPFRALLLPSVPPAAAPIALIEFPTMSGPLGSQWDKFLNQAIAAINERGAAGLIVDIRENGGGSSQLGDALLARINDRPYRMASRIVWRKSPESHELFRAGTKPMWRWLMFALPLFLPDYSALKQGEDLTLTYEAKVAGLPRVEPRFDRPTALLIGERTFSSAMMLADAVRTYDLMLTLGQPTGGVPNALGDIGPFKLPNSRIVVSFSQKMFIRASGDESDLGPVQPHVEVAPVAGRDAALERAMVEIRRMGSERKP
ncbi:MAG: S41 family peptidase [Burkholderiaceae bacterium]|nr:S41 family peptidase [Burkholderiaceae bacterium]